MNDATISAIADAVQAAFPHYAHIQEAITWGVEHSAMTLVPAGSHLWVHDGREDADGHRGDDIVAVLPRGASYGYGKQSAALTATGELIDTGPFCQLRIKAQLADVSHGPLLDVAALADHLGIPKQTVYQWRSRGRGPRGVMVGRHLRFMLADVERWLEDHADAGPPSMGPLTD